MSNPKKNKKEKELDIILEQLKKSYGAESSDMTSDVFDEPSDYEEDIELTAVLSKLFSEEEEAVESENKAHSQKYDETENSDINSENQFVEPESFVENDIEDEIVEPDSLDGNDIEDDIVDPDSFDEDDIEDDIVEPDSFDEDDIEDDIVEPDSFDEDDIDGDIVESDSFGEPEIENTIVDLEKSDNEEIYIDEPKDFDDISLDIDDTTNLESPNSESKFAVEDEEYDISPDSDDDNLVISDDLAHQISIETENNLEYSSEEISDKDTESSVLVKEIKPILILDPDNYIHDDLQEGLPKFQSILSSFEQPSESSDTDTEIDTEEQNTYDDNDIALLLKLGYNDEIKSKIGEEKTHNAIYEGDSGFVVEDNKTPYGFCGKELTDRNQIPRINQKYQSSKKTLIVMSASVFVLFLMISSITIYFDCYSTRMESFPILLFIELILVALVALVLHKKLFAGITGILKFDPDQYSILAFVMSIYALYDVFALIIYTINHKSMQISDFSLFGTCIALYALLTVASDLVTCLKEAAAFDLIASSNKLFTVEKIDPGELDDYHNEKTYKIRRTTLVSGYFEKTVQSKPPSVSLIYIIGVVPLIALIMGCAFVISTGNMLNGITSATAAVFLCIPLSCVFMFPIHEYIISTKLKGNKIALIGYDAADEYAKIQNIVFEDRDVISVSSYSEIQPQYASGNSSLKIAYEVFNALNGTISDMSKIQQTSKNEDVVINGISDNGIDITYSASINILFGDKNYMKAHNIKVKTDSALHGATKGTGRSVLYMAFDGIPKLGFILGSNVNSQFIHTAQELEQRGIKVFVESYEPYINDVYFEQNAGGNISVGIFKPKDHKLRSCSDVSNSKVISNSGDFRLATIVRTSQEIVRQRTVCKYVNYGLMLIGLVLSCLLSIVINSAVDSTILNFIKIHSSLILNLGLLLGLVPTLVTLLKFRKLIPKKPTLQNGDKKPK
ncbi:MAG: hypothetical protein IJD74_00320 [Clostridia bacterium]|nr:hypothetical protein [Clostridia bacterium]